jgi:hypothetical protein
MANDQPVTVRFPQHVAAMVASASERYGSQTSQYVRQAVYERLRADGFDPVEPPQQFALVDAGQLVLRAGAPVVITKLDPDDSRTWLPIETEDSEPFDARLHWREKPTYRVDGGRVVRTYPIVPKSLERA